jgi:hypothetical protein
MMTLDSANPLLPRVYTRNASGAASSSTSTIPVVLGEWTNIVVVRSSTYQYVYVNGVLGRQQAISGTLWQNTIDLTVGGSSISNYFNGSIDDVRIFNAAMSTSQIQEQYYASLNKLLASGSISIADYQSRLLTISKK